MPLTRPNIREYTWFVTTFIGFTLEFDFSDDKFDLARPNRKIKKGNFY